jgi:hypothetical protein
MLLTVARVLLDVALLLLLLAAVVFAVQMVEICVVLVVEPVPVQLSSSIVWLVHVSGHGACPWLL